MEFSQGGEEQVTQERLHQLFENLQRDWNSFERTNPRTKRRHSTGSNSNVILHRLQLLDSSPRNLMSSLQHRLSPPEGSWNIRTNELAFEERTPERIAPIDRRNLKGRRLFEAEDSDSDEMKSGLIEDRVFGWDGLVQESEVRSVFSYESENENENDSDGNKGDLGTVGCHCRRSYSTTSSSSLPDENVEEKIENESEKIVANEERKKFNNHGGSRRLITATSWVLVGSVIFAVCMFLFVVFGGYADQPSNVTLIPT